MNNSRFSIRWKTFCIFLIFAIVLLGVLWLFQIVYLNDFYKIIKRRETETVLSQIEELVRNKEDDSDTIEEIAASHNLGIFITDRFGNTLYNADYIPNSHIAGMPRYIFGLFYDTAVANGGKAVVEYKGSEMQKDSQEGFLIQQLIGNQESVEIISGATPESENGEINQGEGRVGYTISGRENTTISEFRQNIGDDRAESVIYVSIVENDHRQTVVMINSVLTPIDATVTTLEAQLKMISIIMVVFAFVLAVVNSKSVSRSIISLNDGAKKLAQGDYSVTFDSGDYNLKITAVGGEFSDQTAIYIDKFNVPDKNDNPDSFAELRYIFKVDDVVSNSDWDVSTDETGAKVVSLHNNSFMYGDVNDSKSVNSSDASDVLAEYSSRATSGESILTEKRRKAADVNGDSKVDSKDASDILAYYSALSTGDTPKWKVELMKEEEK